MGAGALIPEGFEVPSATTALGVPARIRQHALDPAWIDEAVATYARTAARYRQQLRHLDS
ncbi:hypothetical protein AB0M29_13590 [Streptomyces sp. NPDC051976]|uniref:hypothetical protein n=1 Tax=Streptomyces sp. NPDC051976 TaxID=3154947 RepID=UPI00343B8CC0